MGGEGLAVEVGVELEGGGGEWEGDAVGGGVGGWVVPEEVEVELVGEPSVGDGECGGGLGAGGEGGGGLGEGAGVVVECGGEL